GPELAEERARGVHCERRHVRAEGDLVRAGAEERGHLGAGLGQDAVGRDRRLEGPAQVGVGVVVVAGYGGVDGLVHLRAAGVVEVDAVVAERREPGPDDGRVEEDGGLVHDAESTMPRMRLVILGGGPAGYAAATTAAHLGAEVTLVEDMSLGGNCTMTDAIPSKTLLTTADAVLEVARAEEDGLDFSH